MLKNFYIDFSLQFLALCFFLCSVVAKDLTSQPLPRNSLSIVKNLTVQNAVISGGEYFRLKDNSQFGMLLDYRNDSKVIRQFYSFSRSAQREEAKEAVEMFFWGMKNGIVLELGAMDGQHLSQSLPLQQRLGWHRILIEGSPAYGKYLGSRSPDAFSVMTPICSNTGSVHFLTRKRREIMSGILEYMDPKFINLYHNHLNDSNTWNNSSEVETVRCTKLQNILDMIPVQHINLFILDTEGSELSILNTIDYNKIRFDAICVEVDEKYRPTGYRQHVTNILEKNGYRFMILKNRNAWYLHHNFTLSSKILKPAKMKNFVKGSDRQKYQDKGRVISESFQYYMFFMNIIVGLLVFAFGFFIYKVVFTKMIRR